MTLAITILFALWALWILGWSGWLLWLCIKEHRALNRLERVQDEWRKQYTASVVRSMETGEFFLDENGVDWRSYQ